MKSQSKLKPNVSNTNIFNINIDAYLDTLDQHYHPKPSDILGARTTLANDPNSITKLEILDLNKGIVAFILPRLKLFREEYLKRECSDGMYTSPRVGITFDEWISDIEELIYCLQIYYNVSMNHSKCQYFIDNKDRFKDGLNLLVKLLDDLWI